MSEASYIEHHLHWRGINVTVRHSHRWVSLTGGYHVQHIEVHTENRVPLPITETGYRSHFLTGADALAEYEDCPAAFAAAWLDHAAKSTGWQPKRQGELF